MIRSILAVFLGMVVWAVLWLGANAGIQAAAPQSFDAEGMTASGGILGLILALSVLFSVVSGYLIGALAKRREVLHTFVFGVIQLVIGIFVQSTVWDKMPLWYHLSFLALIVPASVIGGCWRAAGADTGAASAGRATA